jgi:hypothetical protein
MFLVTLLNERCQATHCLDGPLHPERVRRELRMSAGGGRLSANSAKLIIPQLDRADSVSIGFSTTHTDFLGFVFPV